MANRSRALPVVTCTILRVYGRKRSHEAETGQKSFLSTELSLRWGTFLRGLPVICSYIQNLC